MISWLQVWWLSHLFHLICCFQPPSRSAANFNHSFTLISTWTSVAFAVGYFFLTASASCNSPVFYPVHTSSNLWRMTSINKHTQNFYQIIINTAVLLTSNVHWTAVAAGRDVQWRPLVTSSQQLTHNRCCDKISKLIRQQPATAVAKVMTTVTLSRLIMMWISY